MDVPYSHEHEVGLLSCCFLDPLVCGAEAVDTFGDENPFWIGEHRAIWCAFQAIDMEKIGVLTVSDYCTTLDSFKVREIANECVSIANFRTHLKWVQKLHVARRLIAGLDRGISSLRDPKADVDDVIDEIRHGIDGVMLDTGTSFCDSHGMAVATLNKAKQGSLGGIHTHHWRLDRIIAPLPPGSACTIAGYTGQGKTTLFNSMQRYMGEQGMGSALFSMEMPVEQVTWRIVAGMIGRDSRPDYLIKNAATDAAIEHGFKQFARLPIHCKDTSSMSIREIKREIKALHSSKGIKVFGIDHIGLVRQTDKKLSREQHIADVTRTLKETAMEIKGWIFPICQLNRDSQKAAGMPRLHHLRDSGSVEADSDQVVFVYDPNSLEDNARACRERRALDVNLIVAKNRHGGTGVLVVPFAKWCSLFTNEALNEEEMKDI